MKRQNYCDNSGSSSNLTMNSLLVNVTKHSYALYILSISSTHWPLAHAE